MKYMISRTVVVWRVILMTLLVAIAITLTIVPSLASAATPDECDTDKTKTLLGLPKWYRYLDVAPDGTGKCSPSIETTADALPIGIALLEGMLRLGGLVAVGMVFVGAFKFIASQGNPDSATAARKTIINAMIGLVIIILSSGIVGFIGNRFV